MKPHNLIYLIILATITSQNCRCSVEHDEYWQQHVQYIIAVELDSETRIITGKQKICYTNNSPDTLHEIYLHLYPNAFQENSLMAKEMYRCGISLIKEQENKGHIQINSLKLSYRNEATVEYSNYHINETLMNIALPTPLLPGDTLNLELSFEEKIRKYNSEGGKGGYNGEHFVVSQWYPKICVYDENGWNTMPYHWLGEFYGEFGTFDVTISLPYNYIVASTGEVVSGNPGWKLVQVDSTFKERIEHIRQHLSDYGSRNVTRTVRFYAENVHDFVWAASPDFVYETSQFRNKNIHVLYNWQDREIWQNKVLYRCTSSLEWLESYVGEYPYPQLTAIQGVGRNSMEYPMCIVLGMTRATTVFHEVAHIYFYGALANNEQTEGWLDEGLVTYLTELYSNNLDTKASIKSNLLNRDILHTTYYAIRLNYLSYYLGSDLHVPLATPCYQNRSQISYSLNNYVKGSFFFRMLNHVVGKENFKKILRTLYHNYKFQHINEERLYRTVEECCESDLSWFFTQWLHDTIEVDYAVSDIEKEQQPDGTWKAEVKLDRRGDGIMPFDVNLITKNGERLEQRCDGQCRHSELIFHSKYEPLDAIIDPDDVILDMNRLNNSRMKFKFILYPDYPNLYYQPRNSYLISGWPQAWYNDVDKLKIGARFYSGYLNRLYLAKTYFWYGFGSNELDFDIKFTHPLGLFRKHLWYNLQSQKIEGRFVADANLYWIKRFHLFNPPVHKFRLGFRSYQLLDSDYVQYRSNGLKYAYWEQEKINKLYFNLLSSFENARNHFDFRLRVQFSDRVLGSDRDFWQFTIENSNSIYFLQSKLSLTLRNFLGYMDDNGDPPVQERFFIAGGGPLDQFNEVHLRSRGSLPNQLRYHLPGDGNLRGYTTKFYNGKFPLSAQKIAATNLEVEYDETNKLANSFLKIISTSNIHSKFYLFADAALFRSPDNMNEFLADAGFGFTLAKDIFDQNRLVRIDFPLWLNKPNYAEPAGKERQFQFRWLISFEAGL
ncbi:hypothetical protein GF337_15980 [candidate division KSB1 bacterium]|nr:hypothetical protein [candidate division KSB1 bacterium]